MGISSPLAGLRTLAPIDTPRLGRSSAVRSWSLWRATKSQKAVTASCSSALVREATRGCSGASTT